MFLDSQLFCYFIDKFCKIAHIDSMMKRTVINLERPKDNSMHASLAGFKNSHLFLTGGLLSTAVSVYHVDTNKWSSCPSLLT